MPSEAAVIAITREVSAEIARCELTHLARTPIDLTRARAQHRAYEQALQTLGCAIERLPTEIGMPDSVFVEDIAVVFDEVAVVTRPGAISRRVEMPAVADALVKYRTLLLIEAPGTLDGGDVLVAGRSIHVGASRRTNAEGIAQLRRLMAPFGYETTTVQVEGCLHLKSAVTALDDRSLLINRARVDASAFEGFRVFDVDEHEPDAANILCLPDALLYASAFPRTRARLEAGGFTVHVVDNSELAKAEGAMTCGSLLVRTA